MKTHLVKLCACLLLAAVSLTAKADVFSAGSLVIPMDIDPGGQSNGMLTAYGLVYELLRHNVPVQWTIDPAKPAGGDDFAISAGAVQDVRSGAPIALPRFYAGGPFVIASTDAAAALPIVQGWQAHPGDQTVVHRLASGTITAVVGRRLTGAPRIAVLKDGEEKIAFEYLNAAGISDSAGDPWTKNSPDLLTEAAVAGASRTNHADGVLFLGPSGPTRYGYLASMHYKVTSFTPEVVQEVRTWLGTTSLTHAFMECEATAVFENDAAGRFLTTLGIAKDGGEPKNPIVRVPSDPLAQFDGAFDSDGGSVHSIGLAPGSVFRTGVRTLINASASPLTGKIVLLSGRMDGAGFKGKVTYLAGHDYAVKLPVSANRKANGARLFLNSILVSDCAASPVPPNVTLTMSAPAFFNTSKVTYTINFANAGARPAEQIELIDQLPAGTTFASATGGGAGAGKVVTWNLPPLASGASGSVSVTANVLTDGSYTNTAVMSFAQQTVTQVSSSPVTTVRDTVPPVVTIPGPPINPTTTNSATPTFFFSVAGSPVSIVGRIDNIFQAAAIPPSFTVPAAIPLVDGAHTFVLTATDAAGNSASASFSFTVATVPTLTALVVSPSLATVPAGVSRAFGATGIYSDGSNQDLTAQVAWASNNPAIAMVSNAPGSQGVATGVAPGSASIVASLGGLIGTSTLAVSNSTLVSIEVTPVNSSVPAVGTRQFTTTGTYSDGTNWDLSAQVTWSSSNHAVAMISNAPGSKGLATSVVPGSTEIAATLGAIAGTTTLTVTN